jgi:Holliday junction resolvase
VRLARRGAGADGESPSKQRGSAFEIGLLNHFREKGFDAERLRQTGQNDEGDLVIKDGSVTVVEAKAEARYNLPQYLKELALEKTNYAKHRNLDPAIVNGVVIVKRRQASIGECFVVQTVNDYFNIKD